MVKKFLRRTWNRFSKLGKRRKKKQKWRKPTGRDNKMREKRKGYPAIVSIGYKKQKKPELKEKVPIIIHNIKDLEKIQKNNIAHLANIGKKKKIQIIKKAKEMKIKFDNININSFLKKNKIKEKKKNIQNLKGEKKEQ